MSNFAEDTDTLQADASFDKPLRRVAYEAGMLLGLEATRDEQSYHRHRLNRHQYWLNGSGTLAGMRVAIDPPTTSHVGPIKTSLTVSPGIGVDGLGREVLIHEAYSINLGDWLKAQTDTLLQDGYDEIGKILWLKVTVRYQEVPVGLQPVLARKLNLSTDAVQPSRTADSILLELTTEIPLLEEAHFHPWAAHPAVSDTPTGLTTTESDYLATVSNPAAHAQLQLHARLLGALDDSGMSTQLAADQLEEGARILLARIAIPMADLNTIINATENQEVVTPNTIKVNNLVRPFIVTASQVAYVLAHS